MPLNIKSGNRQVSPLIDIILSSQQIDAVKVFPCPKIP